MPILVTCTCGQAIEAPNEVAGQVITCPRCVKSVFVPSSLDSLRAAADEVELAPRRPELKRRSRAAVCAYCNWRNEDLGSSCPSCGRPYRNFSLFGCLFNLLILAGIAAGGVAGWRYWSTQEARAALRPIADRLWSRQKEAYEKGGAASVLKLAADLGWPAAVRSWQVDPAEVEVPLLSTKLEGLVRIRANVVEEADKFIKPVRYTLQLTQRYDWDEREKKWREAGPLDVRGP
ncbi:MAG: hypothetical protein HYZ53_14690 [Planctomycetes bacterium]|nr:hypothetical protein [Planctomycetota bacterium]